jgi:transposase
MSKTFRPWDVDQAWLLPPSVHDFVPEGHLAHFVRQLVRETLDLSEIFAHYTEERGYPPYHPGMMTALILYAYCQGVYSSRRIAKGCEERVDFMAVTGMQKPDFRTVNDFRRLHLQALGKLFVQVLKLCQEARLVKLGHVALDGTKIRANASKNKAMSYERMQESERRLREEVKRWFEQADAIDAAEDEEHGPDKRGDELPDWVANKEKRLKKIQEAKAALEAQAREEAEKAKQQSKRIRSNYPPTPDGKPHPKAQRNFTDPESRIMKTQDGFQQCYNAEAAVDSPSQVIVACGLSNCGTDQGQLRPMVEQVERNTGRRPEELSADADFCSEENLETLQARGIDAYLATGRQKHGDDSPTPARAAKPGTLRAKMATKLKRGGFRSRYRLRKQTVEPVFGQMKHGRGFRQFLLRGLDKVAAEWKLLCTAHNLLKLARATAS